jgi:carboxymethylenebutenolidase
MKWVNKCSGAYRAAGAISAVLLATILAAGTGSSALASAYGEMHERREAKDPAVIVDVSQSTIKVQGAAAASVFRGQVSSVQLDEHGNPSWIQSGIWVMRVLQAGQDSEPPLVQLVARFAMVMPDGSAMHSHNVYRFAVDSYTMEGTTHTFEGTATVTMRDGPVSDVPITVKIFNNSVIAMWIGPDMIDSHFGTGPVYGVLSAASRQVVERISVEDLDDDQDDSGREGLKTSTVNYYGNATGYLVEPEESEGKLPAVVVIHENRGLNDFVKGAAEDLAKEGYVVLAADLYNGRVTDNQEEARALSGAVRNNTGAAIENLNAAVAHLAAMENVDSSRIASLGWCFGGGFSLQLALNADEPLAATVIYYGNLVTDQQELASITWPVLGIFGSEDQVVTVESVNQFKSALEANGTTNEIYIYEGVGHAFANPSNAGHAPEETADAWEKTLNFLSEHV